MKKVIIIMSALLVLTASAFLYKKQSIRTEPTPLPQKSENSNQAEAIISDGQKAYGDEVRENIVANSNEDPVALQSQNNSQSIPPVISETTSKTLLYTTPVFGIKIPYPEKYSYTYQKQTTRLGDGEIMTFGFPNNLEKITIYPSGMNGTPCSQFAQSASHKTFTINGQTLYQRNTPIGDENFCLDNSEYYFQLSRKTAIAEKINVQEIYFPEPTISDICQMETYSKTFGGTSNAVHVSVKYTDNFSYQEKTVGLDTTIIFGKPDGKGGFVSGTKSGITISLSPGHEPQIQKVQYEENCYSGYVDWSTLEIE